MCSPGEISADPTIVDSLDRVSKGAGVDILTGDFISEVGDVLGMDLRGSRSDLVDSASGNGSVSATRVSTEARFARRLLRLTFDEFWSLEARGAAGDVALAAGFD